MNAITAPAAKAAQLPTPKYDCDDSGAQVHALPCATADEVEAAIAAFFAEFTAPRLTREGLRRCPMVQQQPDNGDEIDDAEMYDEDPEPDSNAVCGTEISSRW